MSLKEHSPDTIHIGASAGETAEESLPVNPEDISVAVLYPGNRIEKLNVPLQASRMDVEVEPSDPNTRIVTEMNARAFVAAMQSEELSDEQRAAIKNETDAAFEEFADGVNLEEYDR